MTNDRRDKTFLSSLWKTFWVVICLVLAHFLGIVLDAIIRAFDLLTYTSTISWTQLFSKTRIQTQLILGCTVFEKLLIAHKERTRMKFRLNKPNAQLLFCNGRIGRPQHFLRHCHFKNKDWISIGEGIPKHQIGRPDEEKPWEERTQFGHCSLRCWNNQSTGRDLGKGWVYQSRNVLEDEEVTKEDKTKAMVAGLEQPQFQR